MVAVCFVAVLEVLSLSDIHTDGCIELQCLTAGRDLRVAVHDADLFTELVDEHNNTVGLCDRTCKLSERLAHQSCLKTDMGCAHIAVDFLLGNKRRNRVNDNDIDGTGTDERIGNFQRIFAAVRLGNEQIIDVDTECLCIQRIKRVFRVDECCFTAHLLGLGNDMQSNGRFTGGFRTVDFDNTSSRNTTDTKGKVKCKGTCRDRLDVHIDIIAKTHDASRTFCLFDLGNRSIKRFSFFIWIFNRSDGFGLFCFCCHLFFLLFLIRKSIALS